MTDPTPIVKPGSDTTEYKATKWTIIFCVLATIVGLVQQYVPGLVENLPEGSRLGGIGTAVLTIAGIVGAVLAALGYGKGRVDLKRLGTDAIKENIRLQSLNKQAEIAKIQHATLTAVRNGAQPAELPSTATPVPPPAGGPVAPGGEGG